MDLLSIIALALVAASIPLGWALAKHWRMPEYSGKIILILLVFFAGLAVCVVRWDAIRLGIDLQGGVILVYEVVGGMHDESGAAPDATSGRSGGELSGQQMDKLIAAVARRVNPGGQKEVTIRQFGPRQIEIIVPEKRRRGDDWQTEGQTADSSQADVERLKRILSSAGTLEFRILANPKVHEAFIEPALALKDETQLKGPGGALLAFWVPVSPKERKSFESDPDVVKRVRTVGKEERLEVLVIKDEWDVTGQYLVRSVRGLDDKGGYAVHFSFNAAGGNLFGRLTGNHLPDERRNLRYRLGIILDGYLQSAPSIRSTIFENGIIEGRFTAQEVDELVEVLNAGALPATLSKEPISQRVIGPTLGRDTIEKGMNSLVISLSLVFLSVLVYYRFAGIVACLALVMNGILLLAIMILIQAPFSLPGLAGFALTIGMAVDANVLIYERMREEAARGAALRMTIRNGFERALSAIVDSNLTTMITAVVLYAIGTDQVKGFAVTLFLGILLSMFTAIFCARVVFDIAERRRWIDRVNMMRAIGETNFKFLSHKRLMLGISTTVIVIGLVASAWRGRGLFDIDFTGGISVEAVFTEKQDIADLRARLADLPDVVVSDVRLANEPVGYRFVINTSNPPDTSAEQYLQQVKDHLKALYGDKLSRNGMKVTELSATAARGPGGMQPAPVGRSEWMALSALLLAQVEKPDEAAKTAPKPGAAPTPEPPKAKTESKAQAEPTKKDAGAPEEKPAAKPPAAEKPVAKEPEKPAAKEPEKPAAKEPAKPAVEAEKSAAKQPEKPAAEAPAYRARLTFDHAISHDALIGVFRDQVEARGMARDAVEIVLTHPTYEEGSPTPSSTWEASIRLPAAEARTLISSVQQYFRDNPYFPQSNTIGGAVARNTQYRAVMALLASAVFILLYLWVRFQRVTY
ncbi:MAG: protein translocase subunit SecD, partial [Thermoguttaceae bacterium]|nr:protein translocase subunit SecD [Thermoguttaceae bacterium]